MGSRVTALDRLARLVGRVTLEDRYFLHGRGRLRYRWLVSAWGHCFYGHTAEEAAQKAVDYILPRTARRA